LGARCQPSRLGFDGYRRIIAGCHSAARYLARSIAEMGPFELITDGSDLPVFAFYVKDPDVNFSVFDFAERLRDRGWLVPAYTFPANREDLSVLRIVIRHGFSHDLADMLLADMRRHIRWFASQPTYRKKETGTHFAH